MLDSVNKILVLSPHTDDGEFGCGGTIARLVREGKEVHYAAFSIAEDSVPKPFPRDILAREVEDAADVLGVTLHVSTYPVRRLAFYRQEILEKLVRLGKEIDPDLVLMPSLGDIHQDHTTVAHEGLRAFKKKTILCYELPWNNITFSNSCFVTLSEEDMEKKIAAVKCYVSQRHKPFSDVDYVWALAKTRGVQIGCELAEVFEVLRLVI